MFGLSGSRMSCGNGGTGKGGGVSPLLWSKEGGREGSRLPGNPFPTTSHSLPTTLTNFSDFRRSAANCSYSLLFSSRMAPSCAATCL
jgi:hypothetical protein